MLPVLQEISWRKSSIFVLNTSLSVLKNYDIFQKNKDTGPRSFSKCWLSSACELVQLTWLVTPACARYLSQHLPKPRHPGVILALWCYSPVFQSSTHAICLFHSMCSTEDWLNYTHNERFCDKVFLSYNHPYSGATSISAGLSITMYSLLILSILRNTALTMLNVYILEWDALTYKSYPYKYWHKTSA